jgi:hypothetical protein
MPADPVEHGLPDILKRDKVYAIGEDGYKTGLLPCFARMDAANSGDEPSPDPQPVWRFTKDADGAASLQPSVWLKTGCACHFALKHGRVRWV